MSPIKKSLVKRGFFLYDKTTVDYKVATFFIRLLLRFAALLA